MTLHSCSFCLKPLRWDLWTYTSKLLPAKAHDPSCTGPGRCGGSSQVWEHRLWRGLAAKSTGGRQRVLGFRVKFKYDCFGASETSSACVIHPALRSLGFGFLGGGGGSSNDRCKPEALTCQGTRSLPTETRTVEHRGPHDHTKAFPASNSISETERVV